MHACSGFCMRTMYTSITDTALHVDTLILVACIGQNNHHLEALLSYQAHRMTSNHKKVGMPVPDLSLTLSLVDYNYNSYPHS